MRRRQCWPTRQVPTVAHQSSSLTAANPDDVPADNALRGVLTTDDAPTYNFCHYWSNFEIGAFAWLRSPQHQRFFEHLDRCGVEPREGGCRPHQQGSAQ